MAIIRKGDKKAEAELRMRARQQHRNRLMASDEELRKAGLESATSKTVRKDKKTGKVTASKLSTKKSIRVTKSESPVSGSAITKAKIFQNKNQAEKEAQFKKFNGK
jgi:hypothetical protein